MHDVVTLDPEAARLREGFSPSAVQRGWTSRGRVAVFVAALTLAGCGARPAAVAAPVRPPSSVASASTRSSEAIELSFMSFNIRSSSIPDGENGWEHRAPLVFDVIWAHQPDVVALQEDNASQVAEITDALPGYAAFGRGGEADGGGAHNTVLVRSDRFVVEEHGVFWLSERPSEPGSRSWASAHPRTCTWVRLRHRDSGQPLEIYNTHLDHRSAEARERGLMLIAERVRARGDVPIVVGGDLNMTPEQDAITRFLAEADLVDTYRSAHPEVSSSEGTFHGFRGDPEGRRVDFLFVSRRPEVEASAIVRVSEGSRYPSDHFPITTSIRLPPLE